MRQCAPAKLNLTLHITGRRADGFHLLDSVVVFTELGDILEVTPSSTLEVFFEGEFAAEVDAKKNSVLAAAHALMAYTGHTQGVRITVTKNIPVGAGLGGGSADAAAALKLFNDFWKLKLSGKTLEAIVSTLGSDVPACFCAPRPSHMRGIGEVLTSCDIPANLHVVLIHPRQPLMTAKVYRVFATQGKFSQASPMPSSLSDWHEWVRTSCNDLEPAAMQMMPQLKTMIEVLSQSEGCICARMTGSGSACFGMFRDEPQAYRAETELARHFPSYWIQKTRVL